MTRNEWDNIKKKAGRMGMTPKDCPYRAEGSIECITVSRCDHCGWNPSVEEKRKAELRKEVIVFHPWHGV